MNFKKALKVISVVVAIAGVAVAVYFAIQKLTGTKKVEYFDDNEFFECDNDLEIVESAAEEAVAGEAVQEKSPKKTTKKADA